jgi:hypothetical protein
MPDFIWFLICAGVGLLGYTVGVLCGRNAGYEEGVRNTLARVTEQLWQDIEEGENERRSMVVLALRSGAVVAICFVTLLVMRSEVESAVESAWWALYGCVMMVLVERLGLFENLEKDE